MHYFVELVGRNGKRMFLNPNEIQFFTTDITENGVSYWKIFVKGREDPLELCIADISPLVDVVKEEKVSYSIPIDAILGPQPKTTPTGENT